jgi:hypothetical protein
MSKPIYYKTKSYDPETGGNPPVPYIIQSELLPLPSTGTFGTMRGNNSTAANCKEAESKLKFIQQRDKNKNFPQTFKHPKIYGNHCNDLNSDKIEIEIPVPYKAGLSAGRKQRRASTRRRRASRRKAKKTRHSRKR